MRERPINFNADMVRAVMSGSKTQTRRAVKSPIAFARNGHEQVGSSHAKAFVPNLSDEPSKLNPFGQPGDRLWVRETTRVIEYRPDGEALIRYEADKTERWVALPSRLKHIPPGRCVPNGCHREAARISLEIIGVRVERLQDISEQDAAAEGVAAVRGLVARGVSAEHSAQVDKSPASQASHTKSFAILWEAIYGKNSWQANPWVWVIEFRRMVEND